MKQITSSASMHDTGCSGLLHWDDPEGWDREGSGRGAFRIENTCTAVSQYLFIFLSQMLELFIFFTLQYCIGFAIHQHESITGVHVFPILNNPPSPSLYHPSGSSQCTSPEHSVSCIEAGLVTRFTYDIIHVSMPFSHIIPPSPSPTESKRLFYASVSLLLKELLFLLLIFSVHSHLYFKKFLNL